MTLRCVTVPIIEANLSSAGKTDNETLIEFVHEHKDLYKIKENTAKMCINKYGKNTAKMLNKERK
jgi:competence protein ComGC